MNLRFLIVGLGSMGKRRIRNLLFNGESAITGFDILPERCHEAEKKYGIKIINRFKNIAPKDFDVMIISTSPEFHGNYIRYALKHKKHFFVEHPTNADGYKNIFGNKDSDTVKAPSCTLRFYRPILAIKKIIEEGKIGKILSFQYHMGQYLPDWHPWEDYRKVYFSKKETGACREMLPFELIWLNWVLGSKVKEARGFIRKVSELDMKAEDVVTASVLYENNITGNIMIDVVSRKPFRTLRIMGSKGVLDWEKFDSNLRLYDAKSQETKTISVPKGHPETGYVNEEEMYQKEIKAFLDAVYGKAKYPFTFEENLLNLKVLFGLLRK
ncbi:MAG: Gfo/Idh/MocA family oxidoreductase [bacterium]|nr:Gfo/Idh/MocA family oxidoreductase [bacterium]